MSDADWLGKEEPYEDEDPEPDMNIGIGLALPTSTIDVQAQRDREQAEHERQERIRQKETSERLKRAKKLNDAKRRWMFIRDLGRKLLKPRLPEYATQQISEEGRLRYEQWVISFYYDWLFWILRNGFITLVIGILASVLYPYALSFYQDYARSMEPATTDYFDGRNVYITNVRVPHRLDPDFFLDSEELAWIRKAKMHVFRSAPDIFKTVEYEWRNGKRYNITLDTLRSAVPQNTGTTCICAAHYGIPLNIAFLGQEMWIEPSIVHVASGQPTRRTIVDTLTGPEGAEMWIPKAGRITHFVPEGIARTDLNVRETACVLRCSEFALKSPVVTSEGLITEQERKNKN